ncbi:PREDICTED: NAD-dependent protein deacetylase sirtuin-2-like [Amphimedon queenslandica]|uniref:NAD-dependent protein deacetylase n=1 Tax=Amphimedon queenslandica TaxID=400682 RepID=A0A1X7UY29_AMPQE|nr:PREDICTED: NAD-dependent protein deacetylase sirtuin-2-like [Amphimedon queenslandica]|eukprot:XP_019851847.1 PREDICTED: NAD-dependent protein deacetylase sirtuin-2-like [Amphimedon queenslandica]
MAEEAAFLNALRRLELEQDRSQEIRPKVLDEVTLDGIVKHIQKLAASNDANRIIVMTGAGISTAAGIPDFRTPGTGLYDNLQKYNLPSPQSIFDISYFPMNPKPFFHLAKEMYPGNFKPTLCHYFIRLLETKGLLLRSYTQNIDTLERRAGIADEHLVEAHGAFHLAHCITCGKEYPHEYVKEQVFADKIPLCTETDCAYEPTEEGEAYKGIVKPDIVFFGEALPKRFGELASKDLQKCDLLIVMGTSLTVQPFASLPSKVREDCPRLLINYEKVGEGQADPLMMLLGMGGAGFDFGDKAYRDVFLQGTCDEGVKELAKRLGWEEELMSLYNSEHQKLSETPKEKEKAEAEPTKKVEEKEKESGQVEGPGEKKIEKVDDDMSKKAEGKESASVEKKKEDKGATPQKAEGKSLK